jgi:hypothetical protein
MRSPFAQASRMLLHFDIAAVPSKLCGDRSLRDELQICEPSFRGFYRWAKQRAAGLPPGVTKTDQLLVFAVNWQLSAFVVSRHTFLDRAVGEECECNKGSCRGATSPWRGMGSFAGQKVFHPLARRRALPRDRIKICCEDKKGPPPGGCVVEKPKCGGCDLIWVLTQLPIEFRVVECIHTALKNLSIRRSVEKPGCNPQRAYSIAASPSFTYVTAL